MTMAFRKGEPAVDDAPFFSVVMPTYNRASMLPRSLGSLLNQEFADFEVLVCDDGSDDETARIVAELGDPRIRYLFQENRGVSAARNLGIRHARGRAVCFLDSDDEAAPQWLARISDHFSDPAVGIVTVGVRLRRDGGTGRRGQERVLLPRPNDKILSQNRLRFALAGSLSARRDLLQAIGGYDERIGFSENAELAMRLVPACRAAGLAVRSVERPLVTYHRDSAAWTGDSDRFERIRRGAERVLEVHGESLLRRFPHGYVNYRGVAAINAARLGDIRAARHHLLAALRVRPTDRKTLLRLLLTLVPPLARHVWHRQVGDGPGTAS